MLNVQGHANAKQNLILLLIPFIGSLLLSLIFFSLIYVFVPKEMYLYSFFYDRSWIQYATVTVFWFTLLQLLARTLLHNSEKDAVKAVEKATTEALETDLGNTLVWNDAERLEGFIDEKISEKQKKSLTVSRVVNGLSRLRKTQSTSEIDVYFRTRSDVDFSDLDASYGTMQYLIWLIPTLGFIGTVMGIGTGIGGFANIIQHAEAFNQIKEALPTVTTALGTAFDTTFLALLLSVIVVCYSAVLRKAQEKLLIRIDTLCLDGILPMFREHSQDTDKLVESINECVNVLRNTMNGNRGSIEALITSLTRIMQEFLGAVRESKTDQVSKNDFVPLLQGLMDHLSGLKRTNHTLLDEMMAGRQSLLQELSKISKLLVQTNESMKQKKVSPAAEGKEALLEKRQVAQSAETTELLEPSKEDDEDIINDDDDDDDTWNGQTLPADETGTSDDDEPLRL